ncbi:MAG: hypothetical protein B0D90_02145, partial [Candidatus Sedimenticola endophacoides]
MHAAEKGHAATVALLLQGGADHAVLDDHDASALIVAADKGHTGVIDILLDAGADINAQDIDGATALIWAVGQGHVEAAMRLIH